MLFQESDESGSLLNGEDMIINASPRKKFNTAQLFEKLKNEVSKWLFEKGE